jgi:DMSO reductase anchor subunit
MRFYRGFNNLRYSPVSREAAGLMLFFMMAGLFTLVYLAGYWFDLGLTRSHWSFQTSGWLSVVAGAAGLYYMYRAYRIKARPFWNHWTVSLHFFGNMAFLGGALVAVVVSAVAWWQGTAMASMHYYLAGAMLAGLVLELGAVIIHSKAMKRQDGEGAASHYEQTTVFGKTYYGKNLFLVIATILALVVVAIKPEGITAVSLYSLLFLLTGISALITRALFYILVIPTTMPGAFFWRNRNFQEHARQTGLAKMPQVGVVDNAH